MRTIGWKKEMRCESVRDVPCHVDDIVDCADPFGDGIAVEKARQSAEEVLVQRVWRKGRKVP